MARKQGKKYLSAAQQVKPQPYPLEEAVPLVQKVKFAKFDETVELHMRLGVDPKHADQMVRGTVVLPNGLGRSKKVLVIASGDKQREAEEAGAGSPTPSRSALGVEANPCAAVRRFVARSTLSASIGRRCMRAKWNSGR